ncbi:MAG: ATP-binding protein [Anaerostipes sp.]|uniref:ATP-binding protein n=1 Tax=Anaerostipes sp. TaxID=1872530 RepID=UPI003993D394
MESPGKLPGLVKTDNIRHTHFLRNPKIAEFLKAYSFVKKYGEGVDRMCKELEAVGLQDLEYRLNAFMLQTTIRNGSLIDKKPLFQVVDDAVCSKILTPTISENVKEIIETFDMNQIFGRKEVKKELGYGDYKAGKAIEAMQVLSIVIPVEGKGKYILKEIQ